MFATISTVGIAGQGTGRHLPIFAPSSYRDLMTEGAARNRFVVW